VDEFVLRLQAFVFHVSAGAREANHPIFLNVPTVSHLVNGARTFLNISTSSACC
jgi:hypothetical protein